MAMVFLGAPRFQGQLWHNTVTILITGLVVVTADIAATVVTGSYGGRSDMAPSYGDNDNMYNVGNIGSAPSYATRPEGYYQSYDR